MQILVTKALAAGFAASMAVGGSTTAPMPNATASPAATYSENKAIVAFEERSPLNQWIDKLVYLESEGKNGLKILDLNGLHSFGCLQFQMETFEAYGKKYGLLGSDDDSDKVIYDCRLQKEITRRMIKENPENWRNWYTSVMIKGLGLPPKDKLMTLSMK